MRFLPSLAVLLCLAAPLRAAPPVHAPPLAPVAARLITHGPVTGLRRIALTFDACQTRKLSGFDTRIVQILKRTRTPATFCLGGYWMETHPDATRALARDPLFELGNHSYLHPHMTRLNAAQMARELLRTQDIQYALTGHQGTWFRPPYGEYNPLLIQTAAHLGLRSLTWSIVSGDPDPHVTAPRMVQAVLARARPGAIVIMHVNGRGWHTAQALPRLIPALRARGYTFVTVSRLLNP